MTRLAIHVGSGMGPVYLEKSGSQVTSVDLNGGNTIRRRSWRRLPTAVGVALGAVGGLFVARAILQEWEVVADSIVTADYRWFPPALGLGLAGMVGFGLAWKRALRAVGVSSTVRSALNWYFVGQLGKYVPGGIWPVIGRGELAAGAGTSRTRAYGAVLLSVGAAYLSGIILLAVLLPFEIVVLGKTPGGWWLFLFIPLGLGLLHPPLLRRALTVTRNWTGRSVGIDVPSWSESLTLVVAHFPAWAAVGTATWWMALGFDGQASPLNVGVAAILAWIAGFLAFPVPGGIGVREAVFTLAATSLGAGVAAAVAVTSRLLFMAVDAIGAILSLLLAATGTNPSGVSEMSASSPEEPPSAPPAGS